MVIGGGGNGGCSASPNAVSIQRVAPTPIPHHTVSLVAPLDKKSGAVFFAGACAIKPAATTKISVATTKPEYNRFITSISRHDDIGKRIEIALNYTNNFPFPQYLRGDSVKNIYWPLSQVTRPSSNWAI